jgi:exopolyphosphatase/guanosine-5'-triphosphate,3'-diphosphate pyrophosphatase
MALQLFAVIDIGSFDLELAIYEINSKGRMNRLESIVYNIALGNDTYEHGSIGYELLDSLCEHLLKFKDIIKGYGIEDRDIKVFATSAMREAKNRIVVEDQIKVRCGLSVDIMSNSQQRFLSYKAIPLYLEGYSDIISRESAIVDVGFGSVQVSLYGGGHLKSTQNIRLGALRIQAMLDRMAVHNQDYRLITEELVDREVEDFSTYFLAEKKPESIIAVGDCTRVFAAKILGFKGSGAIPAEDYFGIYETVSSMRPPELASAFDLPVGFSHLILPIAMIYYRILATTGAKMLYITGTSLCDGIAADLGESRKLIKTDHDFKEDIISSARELNRRFRPESRHLQMIEEITASIFDATKKVHGLSKREKLLLQISAILHEVGHYVNITAPGTAGYDIIIATEILGISHLEREIVANAVKYTTEPLEEYGGSEFSKEMYMIVYRFSAILRLANLLDRSHKQKFMGSNISVKDNKLIISIDTDENISLEKGLLAGRTSYFKEAFGLEPEIVVKRKR